MVGRVIVLELNELTPTLMDRFIDGGLLPGFKRLRESALCCVTDAAESGATLEPWIQWTTVHTGLPYAQHKVFDLADGPKLKARRIWDVLSDAGRTVWICGSMNAAVQSQALRGRIVPDPWAVDLEASPKAYFRPYVHLVRSYVQDYASGKASVTKGDFLRFGRFMAANGLSVHTVATAIRQLVRERLGTPKWRRAAILDRLQWDMFRANYRELEPAFSTFFLNSTAHYQHYYWRDMEPERFAIKPREDHRTEYADAILAGYRDMDRIVQECLNLAGDETTVVLCSALGQQPLLVYEELGGKQVFKAVDPAALVSLAGVTQPYRYAPVMAEEFQLRFESVDAASGAQALLEALATNDGHKLMRVRREGGQLYCGCALIALPPTGVAIRGASGASQPFDACFYPLETIKSGGHHPDGLLWIKTPGVSPQVIDRKVSLEEIGPTLAYLCGLPPEGVFPRPAMTEVSGHGAPPLRAAA